MLEAAGLAPDATLEDVRDFERSAKLVCLCGSPAFVQPATFIDLVRQIFLVQA
jgi:hypothetical protein